MKLIIAVLAAATLTGCASVNDLSRVLDGPAPELYDGKRRVVIYCENAKEHVYYLKNEVANSRDAVFISDTKNLIWNIKFTCL